MTACSEVSNLRKHSHHEARAFMMGAGIQKRRRDIQRIKKENLVTSRDFFMHVTRNIYELTLVNIYR